MTNKKGLFVVLVIMLGLFLGACGNSNDGDKANVAKEGTNKNGLEPGEIKTLTYDELIEKLDNEESFFLLPLEVKEDVFEESGVKEYFSNSLKEHGFGAYYIGFSHRSSMSDEEEEVHEKLEGYTHEKISLDEGVKKWVPIIEGLVYVDKGGVMSAYKSQQHGIGDDSLKANADLSGNEITNLVDEYDPRVEERIKKIVDYRVNKFHEWGFDLQ